MLDLNLNNRVAAVRRPVLEVSFGNAAADDWKQAIVLLTLEAGLAPMVDALKLTIHSTDEAPTAALGDTGSVSIGYEDSSKELVFTGNVESVRYNVLGISVITATNGGELLSKLRINQSYEQQKAGDIVGDLAGRAGVQTLSVEDGVEFPHYVIDDRQGAYQQIAELAKKSGYLAYFAPDGGLNFLPFTAGQAVQTFRYTEDIILLQVNETTPVVDKVTTIGEGAAGSQGQEAWSWLVKDPAGIKAQAGEDGPERNVQDPTLRSADASQSSADGILGSARLTNLAGQLLVPGAPAVTVGTAIEITGAPQDALNGLCMVSRVRHSFSKTRGFTTLILFNKISNGGSGGFGVSL